jgi:phosphoglycerate dehydrogenase-like enzyme
VLRLAFAGTFAARLCDIDVLVTMAFTGEMAGAAKRLKLVQVPGAGLDRIDRGALPPGTWLANAYGHEIGIAEYTIGAMLALTREFGRLDASLRQGVWESQWAIGVAPPPAWPELAGKTLGILGYGRIGQALSRRARAFEMEVCAIRRDVRRSASDGLAFLGGPEALDEVLRRADYLAITLSLNDATRGLIGERELGLMRRTAFLVNVARAEIVDEAALHRALSERTIAGAALDVWYRYPTAAGPTLPARHPFHELPSRR